MTKASIGVAMLPSLALKITQLDRGAQLILRAGQAGAFLLLGDDFTTRLGPPHRPSSTPGPPPTFREQAAVLEDLSAINQAIGILLAVGFSPAEAHHELQGRADAAGVSLSACRRTSAPAGPLPEHLARPNHVDTG